MVYSIWFKDYGLWFKVYGLWIALCLSLSLNGQELYTPFPKGFRGTKTNELTDAASLRPFYQMIHDGKSVKVMQIGDSHTRGNFYPNAVAETLTKEFKQLTFSYYGINGAWTRRFYEDDMIRKIAEIRPNLVIISFGTNEAHGDFSASEHSNTLTLLTDRISQQIPNVVFLLTTPQGSYITRGRGRSRRKSVNTNTQEVARSIKEYAKAKGVAVWDLYNIAGGPSYACMNWTSTGLIRTDGVHFTVQGYELQGKLLGEAIIKGYRECPYNKWALTRMMQPSTPLEMKPNNTLQCLTSTRHAY